jgi:hypothetical protein
VAHRSKSQQVKDVVERLRNEKKTKYL